MVEHQVGLTVADNALSAVQATSSLGPRRFISKTIKHIFHKSINLKTRSVGKIIVSAFSIRHGIKYFLISYRRKNKVRIRISVVGISADLGNIVCSNIPCLRRAQTPMIFISSGCKLFVYLCYGESTVLDLFNLKKKFDKTKT